MTSRSFIFSLCFSVTFLMLNTTFTFAQVQSKLYFVSEGTLVPTSIEDINMMDDQTNREYQIHKIRGMGNFLNFVYCDPHYEWDAKKNSQFKVMTLGTMHRNTTNLNAKHSSKVTHTSSFTGGINGDVTGDWGPIKAKIGGGLSKTVTWIKEESIEMTIPPKHDGWIDYGALKVTWSGPYYYVNQRGNVSNSRDITVTYPERSMSRSCVERY